MNKKKLLPVLIPIALVLIAVILYFTLPYLAKVLNENQSDANPTVAITTPDVDNPASPTEKPTAVPTGETPPETPTVTPTEAPTATPTVTQAAKPTKTPTPVPVIDENGWYYSKDDVALYIHTYGKLPSNYITKKEAEKLGWSGGSVQKYKKGAAIGGSYFGNNEGLLPKKKGRQYYECDIDTDGKISRGAKRIIYSNDGLIYYTDDHYESFTLLYGEE